MYHFDARLRQAGSNLARCAVYRDQLTALAAFICASLARILRIRAISTCLNPVGGRLVGEGSLFRPHSIMINQIMIENFRSQGYFSVRDVRRANAGSPSSIELRAF